MAEKDIKFNVSQEGIEGVIRNVERLDEKIKNLNQTEQRVFGDFLKDNIHQNKTVQEFVERTKNSFKENPFTSSVQGGQSQNGSFGNPFSRVNQGGNLNNLPINRLIAIAQNMNNNLGGILASTQYNTTLLNHLVLNGGVPPPPKGVGEGSGNNRGGGGGHQRTQLDSVLAGIIGHRPATFLRRFAPLGIGIAASSLLNSFIRSGDRARSEALDFTNLGRQMGSDQTLIEQFLDPENKVSSSHELEELGFTTKQAAKTSSQIGIPFLNPTDLQESVMETLKF